MKKVLVISSCFLLTLLSFATISLAKEETQYNRFEHGAFSCDVPDWRVSKRADDGGMLLKVTRKSCAVQIERSRESLDTTYELNRNALFRSGNLVSEDAGKHILVQKARFLHMKIVVHKKYFPGEGGTYAVTIACQEKRAGQYANLRDHIFRSGKGVPAAGGVGDNGPAVFKLEVDESFPYGIYLADGEGTSLERIFKSRYPIKGPKLSHDGKRVVFYEFIGVKEKNVDLEQVSTIVHAEICVVNRDGSGYRVLTSNDSADLQPNWTSDNQHIIFTSDREKRTGKYDLDIFRMDDRGGNVVNLTRAPDIIDADPHAYGGKIVFTRHSSVWIMDEAGRGMRQVTTPPKTGKSKVRYLFGDFDPAISYDLKQIVFERLEDDTYEVFDKRIGRYSVCVVNTDGSGFRNISRPCVSEGLACWTPKGDVLFLAIGDNLDTFQKIHVMGGDGSNRRKFVETKPATFLHRRPSCARTADGEDLVVFPGQFLLYDDRHPPF